MLKEIRRNVRFFFFCRRYGSRPCSLCGQLIGPNEQVMRVSPNYVYHLHCFTCVKCHGRLVKGDRYVSLNGQLFCEKDNPLNSPTAPNTPTTKRGANPSKRGAKAAASRAAAAAAAAAQAQQQTFVPPPPLPPPPPPQYHPGHLTPLNNHHMHSSPNPMTQSLLNNNNSTTNNNGTSSSLTAATSDDLY